MKAQQSTMRLFPIGGKSWQAISRSANKSSQRPSKVKNPAAGRILVSCVNQKQSIVVVMTVLLNDYDLGIVVAPAIVMAPRPPTMKAAIVIAVFRDNNCSILRVCGYGWQRNCDHPQSSQGDKKCAHVFLLIGDYPPLVNERADTKFHFF